MSTSLPTSGSVVDQKYRLEELLGGGTAGVVYRAVHTGLEKSFAIKLLKTAGPPAPDALARFRKEVGALGRLRHPHIVEVTDFGFDGPEGGVPGVPGVPYIVSELLQGMPLSDACRDRGPMPIAEALPLLGQIAAALDAAHDAGVLHRDLKPANVFVGSDDPESPNVKVLDFGLAELLAVPDKPMGTPLYLAPEVIRQGQASRSSDIYSFGVLAYELLGGRPPFRGTQEEILASQLEAPPPPLPLPPEVWRPLRATLQKDPTLRPDSAGDVVRRLQKGMADAELAAGKEGLVRREVQVARPVYIEIPTTARQMAGQSAGQRTREQAPEPRKNAWPMAAVLCCVVLVGVLGFMMGRGRGPTPPAPLAEDGDEAGTREITVGKEGGTRPPGEAREPVAPLVERLPKPPSSSTAPPSSPGVKFRFNDIEQACGDLFPLGNYLCLVNRGGEQVAGGARLVLDENLASFTGRTSFGNAISINIAGKERYSLDFGPAKGRPLLPGLYTGAVRWPFNDGPYPGIDVSVGSSGCNTEEGQFRILEIQLTGDNKIKRFVADFETTCNGAIGRISVGQGIEIREQESKPSLPVS